MCHLVTIAIFGQSTSAQTLSFKEAAGSPVAVGHNPSSLVVADFNNDGIPDLAVVNTNDNSVSILLGDGTGKFLPANSSPFSTSAFLDSDTPIGITACDFNGDGKIDLAVTTIPTGIFSGLGGLITGHVGGGVTLRIGNGDGTFSGQGPFGNPNNAGTNGDLPTSIACGYFNTNNAQKNFVGLAVTNLNSGNVSIFFGDGTGNFNLAPGSPFSVGTQPTAIAVADFNNDGKADLAVANTDDGTLAILYGNGDGTFTSAANSPINVGVRPISIALADFNGDGKTDIAVANYSSSTVSVLLADPTTGAFSSVSTFPVGRHPFSIAAGDFNKDGRMDLIVANSTGNLVSILLGKGDGTFAAAQNVPVDLSPHYLAVGDFNRDSAPDFAAISGSGSNISVFLNQTDTTPPVTTATQTPPPNVNGWNNTSVTLTLNSTDNEPNGTGVKDIQYFIGTNPPVVVPGPTASVNFPNEGIYSLNYYGVDNAGNVEATHNLLVQIDLTPPTITSSQSPPANAAGWNNSNVTVTFTCNDNLSGVASCNGTANGGLSGNPLTISTEGAGQVVTGTATDKAGNTSTTTQTINLDKTPPVLTMPTLAPSYLLNSTLTLNFGATDALSGVATTQATFNGAPITSGTTVMLTRLATNTFTLTATDVAGNTATQTATFAVVYNFIGFLPPIPNDGTGLFKLGSTVPVKFQVTDANGVQVSTAIAHLTIQMISGSTLVGTPIDATASGNADVGDLFRFDGSQYIFNWSTKGLPTGTWQLQARLDDGTVHPVVMGTK